MATGTGQGGPGGAGGGLAGDGGLVAGAGVAPSASKSVESPPAPFDDCGAGRALGD